MASFCNLNPNLWPPALWFSLTQRKVTVPNISEMAVALLKMGLHKNLSPHFMEIVVERFLLVPRLCLSSVYYLRRLCYGKALFYLQAFTVTNQSLIPGSESGSCKRWCGHAAKKPSTTSWTSASVCSAISESPRGFNQNKIPRLLCCAD